MKETGVDNLVNLFMNIVVGITLCITGHVINMSYSLMGFLQSFVLSIAIGFFVGTWIPLKRISQKCAGFLRVEGIGEYVVSCIIMAVIMVTMICLGCTFVQAGTGFLFVFIKLFTPFIIVGILSLLVFTAPVGWLVKKIL